MMALSNVAPKISKLVPRLASEHEGEVVATVRAIERTLKGAGHDWHDLAKALTASPVAEEAVRRPYEPADDYDDGRDPNDWRGMARWCREFDCGRLTPREHRFIWDLCSERYARRQATQPQRDWVRSIYVKLS